MTDVPWIIILCPTMADEKYKPHICHVWMNEPCEDCPILKYYQSSGDTPT